MAKNIKHRLQTLAACLVVLGLLTARGLAQLGLPPIIVVQPLGITVPNGGTAVLTVVATSLTPMSYTWLLNNQPLPTNASVTVTTGQTNLVINGVLNLLPVNILTVNNIIPANAGNYSVQIKNGSGTATSSNALLTVTGGISVDDSSSAKTGNNVSSLTWSHVVGGGANRALVVNVSTASGHAVSSITYGGAALTRIGSVMNPVGSHVSTEMWFLKSPAPGTNSIVVTLSGKDKFAAGAASFFGVNQVVPVAGFATNTGAADIPSNTVAAVAGQVVVDSVAVNAATAGTNGIGQTVLWNQFTGGAAGDVWGSSSFKAGAPTVAMSWALSGTGAGQWASVVAALIPASSPVTDLGVMSLDNTSSANADNANSLTWSHTIGVGSDGLLLVSVSTHSGTAVSSITCGGAALTQIGSVQNTSGPQPGTEMWYLQSPAAGTASIVVRLSGKDAFDAGAVSLFGVNQTVPFAAFATNTGAAFTPNVTVPSASGEAVIDSVAVHQATSGAVGTGQVQLWSQFTGGGAGDVWGSGSIEAGAATNFMSWNLSGSGPGEWAAAAVAVNPAPTGAVTPVAVGMTANDFICQFAGPIPATYIILASTNLITWTPVATNILLSGTLQFTDTAAASHPFRYYQAVAQ